MNSLNYSLWAQFFYHIYLVTECDFYKMFGDFCQNLELRSQ
jgi:hypothetical protein